MLVIKRITESEIFWSLFCFYPCDRPLNVIGWDMVKQWYLSFDHACFDHAHDCEELVNLSFKFSLVLKFDTSAYFCDVGDGSLRFASIWRKKKAQVSGT